MTGHLARGPETDPGVRAAKRKIQRSARGGRRKFATGVGADPVNGRYGSVAEPLRRGCSGVIDRRAESFDVEVSELDAERETVSFKLPRALVD
jgi:hypothetical protein